MREQIEVELQSTMGNDRQIAEAAWTSSTTYQGKAKKTEEDVSRIVNMLADLKHSTPFESVVFRFWIRMPIQTDRQHMTHRLQSPSGMSGRYRTMPDDFLQLDPEITDIIKKATTSVKGLFYEHQYKKYCEETNKLYRELLGKLKQAEKQDKITNSEYKRVREVYRGILPQNNMTERVSIMNLRSFCNYQKLRNSEHAQPEIKYVAEKMLEAVKASDVCPIALEALERNNWVI